MARGTWYREAENYWHDLPGTEYLNVNETEELYPIFLDFLEEVARDGVTPQESYYLAVLMNDMGWSFERFDWRRFQEWYDSI